MRNQLALGCMRIHELSDEDAKKLVLETVNEGVLFFDHADIYGRRECEKKFGRILASTKGLREKIIIQTKCGIAHGYYDSSYEHIIKQVNDSLKYLNTEYIDILLIHRPDILVDFKEVNKAFNELFQQGKVKEFGVSNMSRYQLELYQKKIDQPLKYNQLQLSVVHCNLFSQGVVVNTNEETNVALSSGLIEYCMLHNIKIQAWSVLMASWAEGIFIDHPKYADLNLVLEELALKYQVTKNAIAIAWILRHPAEIMPIFGTTKISRVKEMVKAKDVHLTRQEWYRLLTAAGHKLP